MAHLLSMSHRALALAYGTARRHWPRGAIEHPARAASWLTSVADDVAQRAEAMERRFSPVAVTVSPTGPTDDDPMLCAVVREWSEEQWLSWLHDRAAEAPLKLPFRAYKWPVVLAPEVLEADAFIEHAALFHAARATGVVDLFGKSPPGLRPPSDVLRLAAIRETLQALIRIPLDMTLVRGQASFSLVDLADSREVADNWRFRVRAYLSARLAALSLLLDHGLLLGQRASVVDAYARFYDDALLAIMQDTRASLTGERVAHALDTWAFERIEALRETFRLDARTASAAAGED